MTTETTTDYPMMWNASGPIRADVCAFDADCHYRVVVVMSYRAFVPDAAPATAERRPLCARHSCDRRLVTDRVYHVDTSIPTWSDDADNNG